MIKRAKRAETGAWMSAVAYGLLTATKLVVGYTAGSLALRADGFNNVTDVIATVAVLTGLAISKKPRDEDHPYGHSRAETVASLITSFVMTGVGIQVLYGAMHSIIGTGRSSPPDVTAAWVGAFAAAVMFAVYRYNRNLADRTGSGALKAMSKDNLSDALVSVGAVVGIVGSRWEQPWLDPFAALVIGCVICKTAWGIFSDASHILTDGFDEGKLGEYKEVVCSVEGVGAVSDVKARYQGNNVVVDVTIEVSPDLNVAASHGIADRIESKLRQRYEEVKATHVHIEPLFDDRREVMHTGRFQN